MMTSFRLFHRDLSVPLLARVPEGHPIVVNSSHSGPHQSSTFINFNTFGQERGPWTGCLTVLTTLRRQPAAHALPAHNQQ